MKIMDARTRIQLKNILFATDFSPASTAALPVAAEIARRYGATLYTLHVTPASTYAMAPPETWSALAEAAVTQTRQQMTLLHKDLQGVECQSLFGDGEVWPVVAKAIQEERINLVVVGTRGRSGLGRAVLGSEAERILRMAPCPVLTVGPHSHGETHSSGELMEILYATDFGPALDAGAAYVLSLMQEHLARLTLLHVVEHPSKGDLVRSGQLSAQALDRLRGLAPSEAGLWCAPRYVVEEGKPAEKILEVAVARKADLIVLGVHRPASLSGAVTHLPMATAYKVVAHATCPVLTVRG